MVIGGKNTAFLRETAGGKYVAPQPIEARLKTSKWVGEAVLIGVSLAGSALAQSSGQVRSAGWWTRSNIAGLQPPPGRAMRIGRG